MSVPLGARVRGRRLAKSEHAGAALSWAYRHPVLATVAFLVGFSLIGTVFSVFGELVPDAKVASRLSDAIRTADLTAADYGQSPSGQRVDHFTECVTLSEGLGDRPDETPLESAISSRSLGDCFRLVTALQTFDATGRIERPNYYFRYWHGYTGLTRPLLAVSGLGGTRWVLTLIVDSLLVVAAVSLKRNFGLAIAAAFLAPVLLTTDLLEIGASLPHAVSWAVWALAVALAAQLWRDRPSVKRVAALSIVIGALSAYFDLMIALTATVSALMLLAAIGYRRSGAPTSLAAVREPLLSSVTAAAGWFFGLATIWLAKWLEAAALFGPDPVARSVDRQIRFRLQDSQGGELGGFGAATRLNLRAYWDRPLTPLVLVLAVCVAAFAFVHALRRSDRVRPVVGVVIGALAAAIVVPLWYELLSNHSQIHYWLTYRALAVAVGAMVTASVVVIQACGSAPNEVVAAPSAVPELSGSGGSNPSR